jgi:CheY-like chemotaxis protein
MKSRQTILIVDDSENDILLLRLAFKKAEFDVGVREVHDGAEAIAYLQGAAAYGDRREFPLPTLMLLDLNMPMKNGWDVLAWTRAQPGLRRLPIFIMTTSPRTEDIAQAFEIGANSFLVKPHTLDALVEMTRCLKGWVGINHFPSLAVQKHSKAL